MCVTDRRVRPARPAFHALPLAAWAAPVALVLVAMLTFGAGDALAQQTAVCSNTPATDERIEFTEDATSTDAIDIDAECIDIDTTGPMEHGVHGKHEGAGAIDIDVLSGVDANNQVINSAIDTEGEGAHGVYGHHTGAGKIDIDVQFAKITTASQGARGVYAFHEGDGDIDIYFGNGSIDTTGTYVDSPLLRAHGIYGGHKGFGNIDIVASNGQITTAGTVAYGIFGHIEKEPAFPEDAVSNVSITATNMDITTEGQHANGIIAWHERTPADSSSGTIEVNVQGGTIKTNSGWGITGLHQSEGDIFIDVRDVNIRTQGYAIFGKRDPRPEYFPQNGNVDIYAENLTIETWGGSGHGIFGWQQDGIGDVRIDVRDTTITTNDTRSYGIRGWQQDGIGDVRIDVRDTTIMTQNTDIYQNIGTLSFGIYAAHQGLGGNIDINVQGGSIETHGSYSYGIRGDLGAGNGGEIKIVTGGGNTITTSGENAHGIVAYHYGTAEDTSRISIDVGGSVETTGAGAQGVRVGALTSGAPARVAPIKDGYRQQTVTVNGPVMGNAAGVYLAGGGRVVIGRRGSIGAESGIAILATGTVPKPVPNPDNVEAIPPNLRVDLNLGGRRVAQALGENWIINDGGETTIAVNSVVLHEGATGVTGRTASNGAWNVRMREEGVNVDYTMDPDPANWAMIEPAAGVIADRDFSAADFREKRKPPPPPPPTCPEGQIGMPPNCAEPPPPMCPEGQIGTPPNCTEPEPEQPMFMEEYAPRAAVYEALPDFLLRLTGQGPSRTCGSAPDEPVWVRFAGGQGSYEADRSTTGATYDLERFETEGGLSAAFNETTKGWVSVRHVWGAAGIGSPTGGGQIDVRGLGSSVGGAWQSPTGAYARGCFSYMAYNVDFASNQQGLLKAGTDGRAYTLDVEAGRRFALTGEVQLTPRVWVVGSRVTVNSFTDAVDARVSFTDANRIIGGLGFVADTTRLWGEGEFALRGSVDVERLLSGVETRVQVSGEWLSAEATEHGLRFGLNGIYRQGRFSIGAEVAARQELGSDDSEYAGFLNLGVRF